MKTKFRLAFLSQFFIDRNDTLMMLAFLDSANTGSMQRSVVNMEFSFGILRL